MKKAVLLGDSIRQIGYGKPAAELLKNSCEVWQPQENCEFSAFTLCFLHGWASSMAGASVIHWNNGLWDTCVRYAEDGCFASEEEYVRNMKRIARELQKIAPHVIFATTTPVRPEKADQDNATIRRYNALIVPELQKMGIRINDLNTAVSADINSYIRADDQIHLTENGIALCAGLVADAIKKELAD